MFIFVLYRSLSQEYTLFEERHAVRHDDRAICCNATRRASDVEHEPAAACDALVSRDGRRVGFGTGRRALPRLHLVVRALPISCTSCRCRAPEPKPATFLYYSITLIRILVYKSILVCIELLPWRWQIILSIFFYVLILFDFFGFIPYHFKLIPVFHLLCDSIFYFYCYYCTNTYIHFVYSDVRVY